MDLPCAHRPPRARVAARATDPALAAAIALATPATHLLTVRSEHVLVAAAAAGYAMTACATANREHEANDASTMRTIAPSMAHTRQPMKSAPALLAGRGPPVTSQTVRIAAAAMAFALATGRYRRLGAAALGSALATMATLATRARRNCVRPRVLAFALARACASTATAAARLASLARRASGVSNSATPIAPATACATPVAAGAMSDGAVPLVPNGSAQAWGSGP